MVRITHNIDAVDAWLKDAGAHLASKYVPAVLSPAKYKEALQTVTREVLGAFLEGEAERSAIEPITHSIFGTTAGNEMLFKLNAFSGDSDEPVAGVGFDTDEFLANLDDYTDKIAQWVSEFKVKTERDQYKGPNPRGGHSTHAAGEAIPDDLIAERIRRILEHDPDKFINSVNETGLMAFLRKHSTVNPLPVEDARLEQALALVLDAWVTVMNVKVVEVARTEVDAAFKP